MGKSSDIAKTTDRVVLNRVNGRYVVVIEGLFGIRDFNLMIRALKVQSRVYLRERRIGSRKKEMKDA